MSTKWAGLFPIGMVLLIIGAGAAAQSDKLAERFIGKVGKLPAEGRGEREVIGNAPVPITVQGIPGQMRIDPGAPGLLLLSPEYAAKAGLKGGGMLGFGVAYNVGHQTVYGRTQVAKAAMYGVTEKRRVGWTARPYVADIDAVMGPAGIAAPVVRFALRPALPGERTVALPMAGGTGLGGSWFALYAEVLIGGAPMRIRFDPYHPLTIANAGAAERLAQAFDGRLTGATGSTEIMFGIARPIRSMTLQRPFTVGPLSLQTLHVRVQDGNIAAIPDANAPSADPDEIVVTAKRKHDPRRDRITLGADALARCSAIVFDKPARQVRLTCA